MGKSCIQKIKFRTFVEAKEFANTYMKNIVLTLYPMRAFYCRKHKCYHVGHDRFKQGVDKNSTIDVN